MQILENASLRTYNSFQVEAKARYLVIIEGERDLETFFNQNAFDENDGEPFQNILVLGGGSNCLFTNDFAGTILKINIQGIFSNITEKNVELRVGAGVNWNDLINYCLEHNIGGLENLSLIPGTVGAAPVQNIGAYGAELKDYFFELSAYDIYEKKFRKLSKEECHFSYRNSLFKSEQKNRFIITEVIFHFPLKTDLNLNYGTIKEELAKENLKEYGIKDISRIVSKIRVEKLPDPSQIGNAGSFFKNPLISLDQLEGLKKNFPQIIWFPYSQKEVKVAAGWLIEQCGWKGKKVGSVGTWEKQALVIVNHGGATGKDILNFSKEIINSVKAKFEILLEPEVNIIGEYGNEE